MDLRGPHYLKKTLDQAIPHFICPVSLFTDRKSKIDGNCLPHFPYSHSLPLSSHMLFSNFSRVFPSRSWVGFPLQSVSWLLQPTQILHSYRFASQLVSLSDPNRAHTQQLAVWHTTNCAVVEWSVHRGRLSSSSSPIPLKATSSDTESPPVISRLERRLGRGCRPAWLAWLAYPSSPEG